MEHKPSTVEDILSLMQANADLYPDFTALPDEKKRDLAQLNLDTGTAQSYFIDGKLVAVGGFRMVGLGEAWLAVDPKSRSEHKKLLMREVKKELESAKEQIWCLFACNSISENFLKHLGFVKKEIYVRVK